MTLYCFLKDFAGPGATLTAAASATYLAYTFQRKQADIARNKLALDLFDKKYKVYKSTKYLLGTAILLGHSDDKGDHAKIRDLRIEIDEARFFFSKEIIDFIERCDRACEDFLMHVTTAPLPDAERGDFAEKAAQKSAVLRALYVQVPSRFEKEMRIVVP